MTYCCLCTHLLLDSGRLYSVIVALEGHCLYNFGIANIKAEKSAANLDICSVRHHVSSYLIMECCELFYEIVHNRISLVEAIYLIEKYFNLLNLLTYIV